MSPTQSYNETALLLNTARADETAFRRLFEVHWNTKSPVIAEEKVQDVFVKVWLNRQQLPSVKKFNDGKRSHLIT